VKWKKAKAELSKQEPDRGRKSAVTAHHTNPKQQRAEISAEQMDLGEGSNHVVQEGRVLKATIPSTPIPKPLSQSNTEASEKPSDRHQEDGQASEV